MLVEEDFIQINALQHYVFCPRQCALIHVEQVWQENLFTVRGNILHEKVDRDTHEMRGSVKTVRGLRIHSYRLGIVGRCDVVEFHYARDGTLAQVFPVEFKAGKPKQDVSDRVQLCAQVLCLEEMLNRSIPRAAFFYGRIRRREYVNITEPLRRHTEEIIQAVRTLIHGMKVPPATYSPKCRNCSIRDICQPKAMNSRKLQRYIKQLYTP